MNRQTTRLAVAAVAATAAGIGVGFASFATPSASAVPCAEWQQMHPGWPCVDTPTLPPTPPPGPPTTPPPLPEPILPAQPPSSDGSQAGALTPPPVPPGNGAPIVAVPGAQTPALPGSPPQPTPAPRSVPDESLPQAAETPQPSAVTSVPAEPPPVSSVPPSPRVPVGESDSGGKGSGGQIPLLLLTGAAAFLAPLTRGSRTGLGSLLPTRTFVRDGLSSSRQAAVDYAEAYVMNPNPEYPFYDSDSQSDCANFASQVLAAGGFAQIMSRDTFNDPNDNDPNAWFSAYDENVFGRDWEDSRTWTYAPALLRFLLTNDGSKGGPKGKLSGGFRRDNVDTAPDPNLPSKMGLQPGDLIFYDHGDGETPDGRMDHVAVYVGKDWITMPDGTRVWGDVVDMHTSNRRHEPWWLPKYDSSNVPIDYLFAHMTYPGEG
ncbi:amidase domain-containing protein [Nocardia sp. NPDC006044]|uniref:amidase domain-containing protein n=1 Tax=Nocardia sp. NPDC006044 TaxID=3364306 RepID=UPI0036C06E0A